MSTNALESLLWTVASKPREAQGMKNDFHAYVGDFQLDNEELALLESWDVRALASRDVNPLLLTMAFTAVNGFDQVPAYIMKINGLENSPGPQ